MAEGQLAPAEEVSSPATKPAKRRKEKKPRYRGVLAQTDNRSRWMVLAVIMLLCVTTIFTQLGIVSLALPNGFMVYGISALAPIAVTAILLGRREAFFVGLVSGVALYLHSRIMPLDIYELKYVSVYTIFVFALTGSLLGWMFGFALRNNPTGIRRVVYIGIACVVASVFFTSFFVLGAVIKAFIDRIVTGILVASSGVDVATASEAELNELVENAFSLDLVDVVGDTAVSRLGSLRIQEAFDALLMLFSAAACDKVSRLILDKMDEMGIRPLFSMWLFLVVLASFSIVSALSVVSITGGERERAEDAISEDLDYLCSQLANYDDRSVAFAWFGSRVGTRLDSIDVNTLSEEEKYYYDTLQGVGKVLSGYDVGRNGLAAVILEDWLLECNDPRIVIEGLATGSQLETISDTYVTDVFSDDVLLAITQSLQTGEVQWVVYGDAVIAKAEDGTPITSGNDIGFLQAKDVNGLTVVIIQPSSLTFARRATTMRWTRFMSSLLLLEVFALTIDLLGRVVIRPVRKINETLSEITGGNLQARVEVSGTSEFRELSEGINETVDALNGWIAEAETRMAAELAAAKAIQESALPRNFPAFPDIPHFDLYANMNPAREVGGDFYDFFLVGDDCTTDQGKLGFVMADVSGKGVPASLFMMKAKTQLRDYLVGGMELGAAVAAANDQLCDGNDAGMFVTAWVGVLDYATGHIDYVNAGHNPPLLLGAEGWTWLKQKSGLPLGLYDGMPYRAHSVDCHTGYKLLLYTDGVSEAMNKQEELYGEERLEKVANEISQLPPKGIVDAVREDVALFADGAEQADDITIMLLEIGSPSDIAAQIVVDASLSELARVHELVHAELERLQCPERAREQLDIAVEELFVNVCSYAYPDATPENPGQSLVHCTCTAEPPSITIDIVDRGIPFDPLAKPDAVTPKDIADVPIGGLGILMAKRSVDEMTYNRVGGSNILTIVKRW
ncbi:MAG: SpoIIE family protein phosphatase [Atopobiaceae bacterium]|nr:SpoIIE family protein phosphatase [Atopobiaceae bacterium]